MVVDPARAKQAVDLAIRVAKLARPYVKAALERDAANRYSLTSEWWLPSIRRPGLPPGEYHGRIVNVLCDGDSALVWYNPYESTKEDPVCDGASRFPDRVLGIDLVPGSLAHDPWYREMKDIAAAFGVPVRRIRRLGDRIFSSVNLAENAGKPLAQTVSTLTYWGVRLFGGIYHARHALALALACALFLAGCAGGCVTSIFEDGERYDPPEWTREAD